jgi:glutamyl-tRNA synthetase
MQQVQSNQKVASRFAPSPTGDLHLGGARTALYAWLYARHFDGQFILRIEDTDKERSTQASTDAILEAMRWLNLDVDQGPIFQSDRTARYQAVLQQLLAEGKAYRCTCSKERLDAIREEQMKRGGKPKYDGQCRDLNLAADCGDHVIRFRNPLEGEVAFIDQVKGEITIANKELDDFIIARTDGSPTYNFTVVVDDADMGMTHVVRGDDHVNNTPRQINLFNALGVTPPTFAHVPTILGPDGKRLSKRHGAQSVMHYKNIGILPEALNNYLLRLGWSYGDQEIFSKEEMIEKFDPKRLSRSAASFDETKLLWLNQHYLKQLSTEDFMKHIVPFLPEDMCSNIHNFSVDDWALLIPELVERCQTLEECAKKAGWLIEAVVTYKGELLSYKGELVTYVQSESIYRILSEIFEGIAPEDWQPEVIKQAIKQTAEQLDLKMGKVAKPLRNAIKQAFPGKDVSLPLDLTCYLLGREVMVKLLSGG